MNKKYILTFFVFLMIRISSVLIYAEGIPEWPPLVEERVYTYAENTAENGTAMYENVPVEQFSAVDLSPLVQTDFDYTNWQYNEWEDCHYLYLPTTADRNAVQITYTAADYIYLNDKKIISGEKFALTEDEYNMTVGGVDCGKLKVMQSNLGCIYLSTSTGGLDALDTNANFVETGKAFMLDANGKIQYDGELEKITSHGNSSWNYSKKKPYNFKLPKKADLYGMGKAKKWMLIANYLDHSMLRNYFTMELSRMTGVEYVIDSTFVDLYADGSYRGTYQLCERIQVQKTRLDIRDLEENTEKLNEKELEEYPHIAVGANGVGDCKVNSYKYYDIPNDPDDITGGYLLQFQQWNRYGYKADSGFVTTRGQVVQIDGPEKASQKQVLYIRQFMQELEDAIYSDTGYNSLGKHYSEYMDVDSLAAAYIIEEFAMNIDSGATSFYMWKDSDLTGDGKLHFSPIWDYDLAYGVFARTAKNSDGESGWSLNTNNLFAAYFPINGYAPENTPESGLPTEGISWLGKMYKKDEYKKHVAKVWFDRFVPVLNELVKGENAGVTEMAKSILPSAEMSNRRWHTYGGKQYCVFGDRSGKDFMESVDMLRVFAENRMEYLSSIWEPYSHATEAEMQAFEECKTAAKEKADAMAVENDSDTCKELINKAKSDIDTAEYDIFKTLDENTGVINDITDKLAKDLEKQRKADKLAADKAEFEQFKISASETASAQATEDDSEACNKLINNAKSDIYNTEYDETKTLAENKAVIEELLNDLTEKLDYQREYDRKHLFVYGDVDCDREITASDATFILQKVLVGTFELPVQGKTDDWLKYTDVDCDDAITANDAAVVLQKTLVSSFEMPAEKYYE